MPRSWDRVSSGLAVLGWLIAPGCNRSPSDVVVSTAGADRRGRADPLERVPDDDGGLPGAGIIRRYDWFRQVWRDRHARWSARVADDQGAVVFAGDSITQGWGDDMGGSFPGVKVANRGINGDTTRGLLVRLRDDVVALHPSAVVILAGTNDIEEEADPETIAGNMELILAELETSDRTMPIVLCAIFPSSPGQRRPKERIVLVNERYADLVKAHPRVTLLDTWTPFADDDGNARRSEFPDLLHPNERAYDKWATLLRPALAKAIRTRGP